VDQVIWYHNAYYVFANLYSADYARITSPENLIELKYKDRLFSCNWWAEVDSLNNYEENSNLRLKGVAKYRGKPTERS
jgi:hypothetical protein